MSAPVTAPAATWATLDAGEFAAALKPLKAIAQKPTLPHHGLVHLAALSCSMLALRACDGVLDGGAELSASASGALDVLCDAAELAEVVARLDAAKPLRLELARGSLQLSQGRRRVSLPVSTGELVPALCDPATLRQRGAWYRLDAARLRGLVRAALRMASADTTRTSLCGVQLAGLGSWAYAAGADGHRVVAVRGRIVSAPDGAPLSWGLYLPLRLASAWVGLLDGAEGDAELWVPYATPQGARYREDLPASEAPSWDALSAASTRYDWPSSGGLSSLGAPDAAVLRVGGRTLASRTLIHEPTDLVRVLAQSSEARHGARVAPEALAATLDAATITCDRDGILPSVEVRLAPGDVPGLAVSSESRRGSTTEDRVEASELFGAPGAPAAVNPRYLLEAIETARVLGDETDVRVAWEYLGAHTIWATHPAGYSYEDAPWWVTTMGMRR